MSYHLSCLFLGCPLSPTKMSNLIFVYIFFTDRGAHEMRIHIYIYIYMVHAPCAIWKASSEEEKTNKS